MKIDAGRLQMTPDQRHVPNLQKPRFAQDDEPPPIGAEA